MVADMRGQFLQLLSDIGCYDPRLGLNEYSQLASDQEMLSAVICAGLYPSVAQIRRQGKRFVFFTKEDGRVEMHPSSVNAFCPSFSRPWLVYNEKVKTSDIFLRDSTMVSDFALLMFGGNLEPAPAGRTGFDMLGGYLHFSASAQTANLVQRFCSNGNAGAGEHAGMPGTYTLTPADPTGFDMLRGYLHFGASTQTAKMVQVGIGMQLRAILTPMLVARALTCLEGHLKSRGIPSPPFLSGPKAAAGFAIEGEDRDLSLDVHAHGERVVAAVRSLHSSRFAHIFPSSLPFLVSQDLRQQLDSLLREKIENPSLDVHAQHRGRGSWQC
ncbi:unnamed protein product [Closterium sp. Yama58-4]|nr:unnamed protein product [Closterium sp. Yama58-4]